MLSERLSNALSEQVNAEIYSAYLYLAMSAKADRMNFKGVANWLYVQFQEEMAHGLHINEYILERGGTPVYTAIDAPETGFENLKDMFKKVLSHEQYVTSRINKIASMAIEEHDHASYNFIGWYVNEQVEEEATADEILQKLIYINDNVAMLYALDAELGARVFVYPFAKAANA